MNQIRVWDLPTRVFHWGLALAIAGLIITGEVGGEAMVWHFRLGYVVGSLLIFKLIWGFIGGFWSRWQQLTCSPKSLIRFLKAQEAPPTYLGHSPTGSLSILIILLFLTLQVGSGLISDDEISNAGPLTQLVSEKTIQWATYWHTEIGKAVILLLIALHVLAIAWYFFKQHENLVRPMFTGNKETQAQAPNSLDRPIDWLKALLALAISAYLVYRLVNLGP